MEDFHKNEDTIYEGFGKSKSSVSLSDSPNKFRVKTPSSSNEQDPSDLSQTTVSLITTFIDNTPRRVSFYYFGKLYPSQSLLSTSSHSS